MQKIAKSSAISCAMARLNNIHHFSQTQGKFLGLWICIKHYNQLVLVNGVSLETGLNVQMRKLLKLRMCLWSQKVLTRSRWWWFKKVRKKSQTATSPAQEGGAGMWPSTRYIYDKHNTISSSSHSPFPFRASHLFLVVKRSIPKIHHGCWSRGSGHGFHWVDAGGSTRYQTITGLQRFHHILTHGSLQSRLDHLQGTRHRSTGCPS